MKCLGSCRGDTLSRPRGAAPVRRLPRGCVPDLHGRRAAALLVRASHFISPLQYWCWFRCWYWWAPAVVAIHYRALTLTPPFTKTICTCAACLFAPPSPTFGWPLVFPSLYVVDDDCHVHTHRTATRRTPSMLSMIMWVVPMSVTALQKIHT